MKDIHSHILYGIDDGAKSLEESVEILRMANRCGVTDIILTPHYIRNSIYSANITLKKKILNEIKRELKKEKIDINLYLGNEVYIDSGIFSKLRSISCLNNSRYILIELPLNNKCLVLEEVLYKLKERNLIPIIAHPERYTAYYKDYSFFANLIKDGCLLQGNIGSLYGDYGNISKRMIKGLLKRGMIHFMASDIHHSSSNIYQKDLEKRLFKIVKSREIVDNLLVNNASKVIEDELGVKVVNDSEALELEQEIKISKRGYFAIKRLVDIMFSLIGMIFLLPIALVVKIMYLITGDFHSIFYTQKRVGRDGKIIHIYKFRSMVKNADEVLLELLKNPKYKKEWKANQKLENDPRITKIGNILRKTSLDEMPQFINVLKGDMSFIGPRPLVIGELDEHNGDHDIYESVRPGITGWWACNGRSDIDYEERLDLEYYYAKNCSILLDIKCFFKTIAVVFLKKGAK